PSAEDDLVVRPLLLGLHAHLRPARFVRVSARMAPSEPNKARLSEPISLRSPQCLPVHRLASARGQQRITPVNLRRLAAMARYASARHPTPLHPATRGGGSGELWAGDGKFRVRGGGP